MTTTLEVLVSAALAAAALAARPSQGTARTALFGALAGLSAFGLFERPLPTPVAALFIALFFTALSTVALGSTFSPLVSEALIRAAALGLPAALAAAFTLRRQGLEVAGPYAAAVLALVALFSAEACRANAEAGWRSTAMWALAVMLPPLVFALFLWALRELGQERALATGLTAVGVALLAFLPVVILERRRARRELSEEVRLGLLPADDADVLLSPWKRAREPRFGRPDERHEYVRSALLLAVARQQQRRRRGEAARLRQLEILTFRTRIRRTLAARASRTASHDASDLDS